MDTHLISNQVVCTYFVVGMFLLVYLSPLFPTMGHVRSRIKRPPLDLVIVDVFVCTIHA